MDVLGVLGVSNTVDSETVGFKLAGVWTQTNRIPVITMTQSDGLKLISFIR